MANIFGRAVSMAGGAVRSIEAGGARDVRLSMSQSKSLATRGLVRMALRSGVSGGVAGGAIGAYQDDSGDRLRSAGIGALGLGALAAITGGAGLGVARAMVRRSPGGSRSHDVAFVASAKPFIGCDRSQSRRTSSAGHQYAPRGVGASSVAPTEEASVGICRLPRRRRHESDAQCR